MTDKPTTVTLRLAAADATASTETRTISGIAVPYGPIGRSSVGAITFARGSLSWARTGRVKLLVQHDQERPVGFATELLDTDAGLRATFRVPEGPEGDAALAMAADGRRDGLSVGVALAPDVIEAIWAKRWEEDDSPTAAAGDLLEVSLVSIPGVRRRPHRRQRGCRVPGRAARPPDPRGPHLDR